MKLIKKSLMWIVIMSALLATASWAADDPWQRSVSLDIKDTLASQAFETLFKGTGLNYALHPDASTIVVPSLSLRDVPLRVALDALVKTIDVVYREDNGIVLVAAKPGRQYPMQRKVNLTVKDMPLADALQTIFEGSDVSYTVDPSLNGLTVSANLKNAPLIVALKAIAKTAGLVYRVDNGIYMISASPTPPTSLQPGMPAPCATSASGSKSEVVNMQYLTAAELLPILAKSGRLSVTSTSNNKLVLTGSSQDISEAQALIKALDVAPKMVKPVRLTLTIKISLNRAGGDLPCVFAPSVQNSGPNGSPIRLQFSQTLPYTESISTVVGDKVVKQDLQRSLELGSVFAFITPVISTEKALMITGQGDFSWTVGSGKLGTIKAHFDVATAAVSNIPVTVLAGDADIKEGNVHYELLLTAEIQPGEVPAVSQTQPQDQGYGGISGCGMQSGLGTSYGRSMPPVYNPSIQCAPQQPVTNKP